MYPNKRASKINVNVSQSYCRICERMVVGFKYVKVYSLKLMLAADFQEGTRP